MSLSVVLLGSFGNRPPELGRAALSESCTALAAVVVEEGRENVNLKGSSETLEVVKDSLVERE